MADVLPDARDLDPADTKAAAALTRYRLASVAAADRTRFEQAWGALFDEFAPRGEIERRTVVERWLAQSPRVLDGELRWRYSLLAAYDETGELAGARDCHTTVDRARGECVVYLAHTLVLPAHRRGGLGSLLRAAPVTLARRALADAAMVANAASIERADILLAAEMEPYDPAADDTLVRLVAYGRAGFRAVPPAVLPYCQPDFRDLDALGEPPRLLPLLAVVRWVGHESASALPARLCKAYVRHLYAVFATHCRPADLHGPRQRAEQMLARAADEVPLLPLPAGPDDRAALATLLRDEVLRHHPSQTG